MIRSGLLSIFKIFLGCLFLFAGRAFAAEPIDAPPPASFSVDQALPPPQTDGDSASADSPSHWSGVRVFPAVLETRRYGPVEEPTQQFYSLRNGSEPGFDWSQGPAGPYWGYEYEYPYSYGGYGFPYANFGYGLVGYNRYFYRPWYSFPNQSVWSDRFPWYSPGGVGPNIYQPWYIQRNSLPWYSPNGIGPNIYTPNYTWQMYYPWYSPNGPGPNIYTPSWQYGGYFYW